MTHSKLIKDNFKLINLFLNVFKLINVFTINADKGQGSLSLLIAMHTQMPIKLYFAPLKAITAIG